ncbi:MAG: ATP-binding protein, partial [Burkholderiales bacterium]|nr:ATP-binding protein [Burkholderiales bacterium]
MTMTQEQTWTWTFEEQIPSDAVHGVRVIQLLLDRLAEHRWTENDLFGIHLALEEAVMNAIRH